MPITQSIFDTATLMGVLRDDEIMQPPPNFWLRFFTQQVEFEDEYIEFEEITSHRKLAPLVVPMAQGRPVYEKGSKVTRVKPAYVKPKDAVLPTRMLKKKPGLGELSTDPTAGMSPEERFGAIAADILRQHRETIERRWEWMAAQAILYGQVTLSGPDYPPTLVDFDRDASRTVTLALGSQWGDAGVNILRDINNFRSIMRGRPFGGRANVLVMGKDAYDVFAADSGVQRELDKNYRNEQEPSLLTGVREMAGVEYVGNIARGLPVYVYDERYEDDDGTEVSFMDPRDIVLIGDIGGVRAFGAILDEAAGLMAMPMFAKSWTQEDPSARFIMTQSAPLMVPTMPNRTLRARVIG